MLLINVNERPLSPAMQTVVCGVPMTAMGKKPYMSG